MSGVVVQAGVLVAFPFAAGVVFAAVAGQVLPELRSEETETPLLGAMFVIGFLGLYVLAGIGG
ncbi:MAG: hypothetical protein ACRDS0_10965 [Pseudonocardiaceae bacterium]